MSWRHSSKSLKNYFSAKSKKRNIRLFLFAGSVGVGGWHIRYLSKDFSLGRPKDSFPLVDGTKVVKVTDIRTWRFA